MQRSILIVDDEPWIRELLQTALAELGAGIHIAANGMAALLAAHRNRFAVIICDVRLPLINGEALIPQFLAANPQAQIVMMSGYAAPELEQSCLRLGARAFLHKPFGDVALVVQLVAALLAPAAESPVRLRRVAASARTAGGLQ